MAKTADKMICPGCGVEMNYHCGRLVYVTGLQDTREIGPIGSLLGGYVSELHTCPKCGRDCRRARVMGTWQSPTISAQ